MTTDTDTTETLRRDRQAAINAQAADRRTLEQRHGRVWDTHELGRDFQILAYRAPYVVVRRRSDARLGSLEFQHRPRLYFNWEEDT